VGIFLLSLAVVRRVREIASVCEEIGAMSPEERAQLRGWAHKRLLRALCSRSMGGMLPAALLGRGGAGELLSMLARFK